MTATNIAAGILMARFSLWTHWNELSRRVRFERARGPAKGFEVMRMFRKGQFKHWIGAVGGGTEASFVNRLFGVYA